ncbi:uncharacterized protein LOC111366238 isoform X1 [Olea europaea var. sylvestris]|uniref:Uncharacterized protein n=1 Tax=Olea europaea subsp. europaea TaxID=158383 RepID=A0A8S0TID6_OLEEU|nr:uncharacterized protein LOC111366238 isoform X1 [Olea europaea var. sylvestris]CAA3003168.1 Hypothetical predicted protein [Olea europaea subsp. europaea]
MAEELWLPSEFLADEKQLMKYRVNVNKGKRHDDPYGFENFYRPNSNLSSPVESIENESDEDDYITGLTRKIANSTLRDPNCPFENPKGMGLSCSPQSTLCSVTGWCECKHRSSCCISRVSSHPRVNLKDGAAWDLLYAATEEAARMRMIQEANGFYSSNKRVGGVLVPPRKPGYVTAPLKKPNYGSGIFANQSHLSYRQLQATQFQELKLHSMMKQRQGSGFLGQEKIGYQQMVQSVRKNGERSQGLSVAAWPTLPKSQQKRELQPGSGMRAVFLGDRGTKKERSGTGVFLPRRFEPATGTRKKPGCSTFLIPDQVAQALNLNLESMNTQPRPQIPDYDAASTYRNNLQISEQNHNKNLRAQPAVNQEPRLPQEWTY